MKHISELSNTGEGLDCLIIGGGMSARGFDYSSLPPELVVFELNYPNADVIVDYQVYYDEAPNKFWEENKHKYDRKTIGFKTWSKTADYFYDYNDMEFGDTGYHTLQFADGVFNFDTIYIIGFDYKMNENTYHWYELKSDREAMKKFKSWNITKILPLYAKRKWKNKIYNLSPDSAISAFEYKKGV